MTGPESGRFSVPALPPELLDLPLEYLIADHDRHRAVCAYLRQVARDEKIDGTSAREIARFLRDELKPHFEDERLLLYPTLRSRSADDLDFIRSLQEVEACHTGSEAFIDDLVDRLGSLPAHDLSPISHELSERLTAYVEREHQSLMFENAVIMVIAEVRLRKNDIEKLRIAMKTRRGFPAQ